LGNPVQVFVEFVVGINLGDQPDQGRHSEVVASTEARVDGRVPKRPRGLDAAVFAIPSHSARDVSHPLKKVLSIGFAQIIDLPGSSLDLKV